MKGLLLDFNQVDDARSLSGVSDQVLRTLKDDEMVLQMFTQTGPAISIGYDDTKAPHFDAGVAHYKKEGIKVSIRGAGGRSVASDEGILNFSILMKNQKTSHDLYVFFYEFIQDALRPLNLHFDLGEVTGAYCPGTYDISLAGKKVAGTASRKVNGNALIGCYLGVNGNQNARSKVISEFYEITQDVIRVQPNKLTTLSEQAHREVSIQEVKEMLITQFQTLTGTLTDYDLNQLNQQEVAKATERMAAYNKTYIK